jgi:hypothetical protein
MKKKKNKYKDILVLLYWREIIIIEGNKRSRKTREKTVKHRKQQHITV